MITGTSRPWTNWEATLLRMYVVRVKIFEYVKYRPSTFSCDGAMLNSVSVKALRRRYLVERTKNDGRGKITWSLTDKGRALAKELLA